MASTTTTNLKWTRWTRLGTSGPQPLAGTLLRAAEAYSNMASAAWSAGGTPAVPAHDVKAASPAPGDAFRQTWGYDKEARTERSACGAACYSFRLPADALSGPPAEVVSVSVDCSGDRWLECGAQLTATLSADAEPPAWDALLAEGVSSDAFLVPPAETAGGEAIHPNDRADRHERGTVSFQPRPAAAAYLHLCIRVADYGAVRGAWHEGGAMIAPATVSVEFGRPVEPDDATLSLPWLAPERESGADAALSRTGAVFAAAGWPSGVLAGLDGDALAAALGGVFTLPRLSDPVPFNAHTMTRLGRYPDIGRRGISGDFAMVGAVPETWSGISFPWLCGFVMGLRAETRGARTFRALRMGVIPAKQLSVRVALYLAPETPHAERGWRHATPDASLCAWQALFCGAAESLPFAEGVSVPLSPLGTAEIDLSRGHSGEIPAAVRLDGPATVIAAVSPLDNPNLVSVRWPVAGWELA